MYRIGQKYKIELKKGIFYTGTIIEESSHHILIDTIRNEEIVLNKEDILQAKLMDRIENGKDTQVC